MKMKTNGIELHYTVEGEGPWMTLSHSLACDSSMWDPQMALLTKRFKVLRFDTRGHGASDAPEGVYTLEQMADDLHGLGFFHFDQIAAWTSEQVNWVDDHLKFNGRIKREEWIRQARLLAEGKEAEFTKLYGTGGLRNRSGETLSGSRTRKS